jgi:hypothetical protein
MAFQALSPHLPQEIPKQKPLTTAPMMEASKPPNSQRPNHAPTKAPNMNPHTK